MKQTLNEVLDEIRADRKDNGKIAYRQFTRTNFEKVCRAIANDPDFETDFAVWIKDQDTITVDRLKVSYPFRLWLKRVLEQFGIDKNESKLVLEDDYEVPKMDWCYDFFATVLYEYIASGNKFMMIPKSDFKGKLYMKENEPSTKRTKAKNPRTGEYLGEFEIKNERYCSLAVESPCPDYLKTRRKMS